MTKPNPDLPADCVVHLGATLSALAVSPEDRDCLDVFAEALSDGHEGVWPLLFTVLVEPLAGAQIITVGHVRPGMTFQVDADLQVRLIQLWYPETEGDR